MSSLEAAPRVRRGRWSVSTLGAGVLFGALLLGALVLATQRPKEHPESQTDGMTLNGRPGDDVRMAAASPDSLAPPPAAIDASRRTAIVAAAERVGPAVVTLSVVQTRVVQTSPLPFGDEFFEPFFRDMIPQYRYREQMPSMGSGFVISPNGYVLTNEHVVRGAEKITAILPDGRRFEGQVKGSHPQYDLAIVKIEGKNLPVAHLGTSSDLMVGEWAIAIGNPFGFLLNDTQPTVTAGVISATHRDIKSQGPNTGIYKNMIQTDAAINPGNSGGPLVNAKGDVIGINTFIFTKSGGSEGIGFAIPIDAAKRVVEELIKYGKVRNVWIGVRTWELTPYVAERLGTKDRNGLYVSVIERGSPADKAGIKVGDIIRRVNGTPISDVDQAYRALFGANVGDTISLTVERDGKLITMSFALTELPE
ncbi:MAG TPA: trypsin-like peptidase domain-containing protein [Candidatus Limnocylindrales bacterium]|nr:trypsin-like peptidase domain-containing protein [Candidatus Limnocylindrales bacterium]